MNIKHVTSLEVSKKYQEVFGDVESEFVWTNSMRYDNGYDLVSQFSPLTKEGGGKIENIPALLATEILDMLPEKVAKIPDYMEREEKFFLEIVKCKGGYTVEYVYYYYERMDSFGEIATTIQDAAALMHIRLKEEGLLDVNTLV